jgi:type IV pilus assembly protein PilM
MSKLNNYIALDISDNSLEVMECQRDFWGRYVIKRMNRSALEKGTIVDGDIKNANALMKSLKKLLNTAKPSAITCANCLLSIPENKVFTHIFHVPIGLKNNDIEDFLLNQSEGIIPFNRETIISDYAVVDTTEKEKIVLYAAAPSKLINDILGVLKNVKINVLSVELESLSVARSLLTKPLIKDSNMIVDIGGNFSNIAIYDKQGLKLTVSLPLAGNQFTKEIRSKTKLTIEKSSQLKIKYGLSSSNAKAVLALRSSIDKIIEEITRSIAYFEKKTGQTIKRVLLVGGSAKLPGIVDYLTSKIDIEIISGNPWHRLKKSAGILKIFKKREGVLYSTVIGLMLRGQQKDYRKGINLLPSNKRKGSIIQLRSGNKRDWIKYVIFAFIIIAFALLLVFKDDIRGDREVRSVVSFDTIEKRVSMVVSYSDEEVTDFSASRIKGDVISHNGEVEEVWSGVSTKELTILAEDYLEVHNDSDEEVTLIMNSRLSQGVDIFYLAEALRLDQGDSTIVRVVRQDDQQVVLNDGIYRFIALPEARQDLIYGEKKSEFDMLPPEQISQVDVTSIIGLQELLRQRAQEKSYSSLAEGVYVNDPLLFKIDSLKYISLGDGKVGVRLSVQYSWLQVSKNDLIDLTLDKLEGEVSEYILENAGINILISNSNESEKVAEIDVVWSILK